MSVVKRKLPINPIVFGEYKDAITKMKVMLLYYWMRSISNYDVSTEEEFLNYKNEKSQLNLSAYRINKELGLSRKNIGDYLQGLIDNELVIKDDINQRYIFNQNKYNIPGYFQMIELDKLQELVNDCIHKQYGERSSDGRVIWLYCKMASLANMSSINFSYYGLLKELGFSNKTKSTAVSDILNIMEKKKYFDIYKYISENDQYGNYKYVKNFGRGTYKESIKSKSIKDSEDFPF